MCRWYHGAMTRADAEKLLSTKPVGSFLLRDSESYRTGYSLSIRWACRSYYLRSNTIDSSFLTDKSHSSSDFLHIRVSKINERYILGQYSKPFDTVPQCIAHYCKESLPIKRGVYAALIMPVCRWYYILHTDPPTLWCTIIWITSWRQYTVNGPPYTRDN